MKQIWCVLLFLVFWVTLAFGQGSPPQIPPGVWETLKIHQNIMAHGAKNDDTSVSSVTAIKRAIAATQDSGGTVYIPAGRFKWDSTIVLSKKNMTLRGVGAESRIYCPRSIKACSLAAPNVTIEGITWVTTDTGSINQMFIHDSAQANLTVRHCRFEGGGRQIRTLYVNGLVLDGNYHTGLTDHRAPVAIWGSHNFAVTNNTFRDITFPALEPGGSNPRCIYIQRSSNGSVSGNTIAHCDFSRTDGGAGISISTGSHDITVSGNVCCSLIVADGILTEDSAYSISITGNICSWNDYSVGFDADSVTGNGDGIDVFNSRDVVLTGNICNHNGRGSNNKHPGIEIWGCSDIYALGNICDSNGQNGFQIVQSSRVTLNGGSAKYNGKNGVNIAGYALTVNTSGTSVTRTSGLQMGMGWKRGDTLSINSVKYLIAAVTGNNTATLQSSAGTQTGVTALYRPYDFRVIGMSISDNNTLDASGLQFHNGIYIDGSTGWLINNTITNAEPSGSRTQKYGVTIAGGSVQYYGNRIINHDTANFNDLVGTSVGIVDTLSVLTMSGAGQNGALAGDSTRGSSITNALKLLANTSVAGRGYGIYFFNTISGVNHALAAIKPALYTASDSGQYDLNFLVRATSTDSILRRGFCLRHDRTFMIGIDTAHEYRFPLARPTGAGAIYLLADSSGKGNMFWIRSDSVTGTGGGSSSVGIDSTAASGGVKTAASGIFRMLGHNIVAGVSSNGDTVYLHFDSSYVNLIDSALIGANIKMTADGIGTFLDLVARSLTSSTRLDLNFLDSLSLFQDGRNILNFYGDDSTTHITLGDNVNLQIHVDAMSVDTLSAGKLCIDTCGTPGCDHAWCFGNYLPGDSTFDMHVRVSGTDSTIPVPFSALGGGGGTDSAAVAHMIDSVGSTLFLRTSGDTAGTSKTWRFPSGRLTALSAVMTDTIYGSSGAGIVLTDSLEAKYHLIIDDTSGTGRRIRFHAPALAANRDFWLPAADGTSGQALTTNGSGIWSFSTVSGGGSSLIVDTTLASGGTKTLTAPQIRADSGIKIDVIANDSVMLHVTTGGIGATQLGTGAVTNTKIGANAVDSPKIANSAVGTTEVADGSLKPVDIDTTEATGLSGYFLTNDGDTANSGKTWRLPTGRVTGLNAVMADTFYSSAGAGLVSMPDSAMIGKLFHDSTGGHIWYDGRTKGTDYYLRLYRAVAAADDSTYWGLADSNSIQGVSLPSDVAAFSSSEFFAKVTGETGSGAVVGGTSPTLSGVTATGLNVIDTVETKRLSLDTTGGLMMHFGNTAGTAPATGMLPSLVVVSGADTTVWKKVDSNNVTANALSLPSNVAAFTSAELAARLTNETGTGVAVFMTALQDSSRDAAHDSALAYVDSSKWGANTFDPGDIDWNKRKFNIEFAVENLTTTVPYGTATSWDNSWWDIDNVQFTETDVATMYLFADSTHTAADSLWKTLRAFVPENATAESLVVSYVTSSATAIQIDSIKITWDSTSTAMGKQGTHVMYESATDLQSTSVTQTMVAVTSSNKNLWRGSWVRLAMLITTDVSGGADQTLKCLGAQLVCRKRQ